MTQYSFMERPAYPLPRARVNRKGTIVLFGEVLADMFPERAVLGGAPFNVARHLKAFGQDPVLITRLGHDSLRDDVLEEMARNEMEILGVQCGNRYPTGRVQVHIDGKGHRFEILPEQAYDYIHPAVARMTALSVHPALVYFGTLSQRNEMSRRALRNLLRNNSASRFLDVNLRSPWYDEKTLRQSLQYADTVKLNADELGVLAEIFELSGGNQSAQASELINRFDLARIVVTCGEEGAWQINREGKRIDAGAQSRVATLVDTVGAGDGFAAVCILGSLRRWPVVMTLERANTFAAAICEIRGAIPDHADFYKPFNKEWGV